MGLALSPDGKWLAAGRYDGTVGVYPTAGGVEGEQYLVPADNKPPPKAPAAPR